MITAAGSEPGPGGLARRGYPRRMCRWRWRRPGRAPHGPGPRRPRHSQWPGRRLGRAVGAPQQQVPRRGR